MSLDDIAARNAAAPPEAELPNSTSPGKTGAKQSFNKAKTDSTTHSTKDTDDTLRLDPAQRVTPKEADGQEIFRSSRPGIQIEGDTGPILRKTGGGGAKPPQRGDDGGGGGGGNNQTPKFHKRGGPDQFAVQLEKGKRVVRRNIGFVMVLTCATNLLVLAIPIYLFQISDRVLTSRSLDTLIMLTIVIGSAVVLQAVFDAVRRFILMRTAVEVAVRLGAPVLSAAAQSSLHDNGRQYQTLGDLQQLRGFLTSGT
ncbi:MAG TPA: type I secretion system permease/ATPase, partial [Roseovarius nubinhibens]|nr:type I secretion system permease/ATPase [Roseovarius nubinhibens]